MEEEDLAELLAFTQDLDFDKYIEDLEVKTAQPKQEQEHVVGGERDKGFQRVDSRPGLVAQPYLSISIPIRANKRERERERARKRPREGGGGGGGHSTDSQPWCCCCRLLLVVLQLQLLWGVPTQHGHLLGVTVHCN